MLISFFSLLLACGGCWSDDSASVTAGTPTITSAPIQKAPLDIALATTQAEKYVDTLFATKNPKGPVCLSEASVGGKVECSFSYQEGEQFQVKTVVCGNNGCSPGVPPSPAAVAALTQVPVTSTGEKSITDDWLFWYLLMSNNAGVGSYNTWYSTTPVYARTAYYTTSSRPTTEARTYYTTTYSKNVATGTSSRYTPIRTTTTTTTRATTSSPSGSSYKSTPSKSSGYGVRPSSSGSSRSSGYGSRSSSSSSRSSGGRR